MPFTEGETKTISYLGNQFKQLGLEPGNGESYLQEVPMVNILATAAPSMQVKTAGSSFNLKAYDDYVIWTDKTDSSITLADAELVFAGFGVVAPEYNWNDYEGLDVKGKVVLVMVNDPGFWIGDTSLFKGKEMTYYGRWTYKFEEAARQGAKGCLIIHNTAAASYPFIVQQGGFNTSRLQLDTRGKDVKHSDVIGWITEPAANRLFAAAGKDSNLLKDANKRGFKPVPLKPALVDAKINYWKTKTSVGINVNQASFSDNWNGGGVNSLAIGGLVNYKAEYSKESYSYASEVILQYGKVKNKGQLQKKTTDRIYWDNKAAVQLSKNWYFFASINFESQFDDGFSYSRDAQGNERENLLSKFMSPGYLTES
ncbi:MAG: DUF3078 domain-containing protein, partial [Chitinophagaceae bacterium]